MRIGSTNMVEGEILIKARYHGDHIGNRLLWDEHSAAHSLFARGVFGSSLRLLLLGHAVLGLYVDR